jgi:hypothetical protein
MESGSRESNASGLIKLGNTPVWDCGECLRVAANREAIGSESGNLIATSSINLVHLRFKNEHVILFLNS